jgi:CrcB protein
LAGALGALARFGVNQVVTDVWGQASLVATLSVNVLGSGLLGVLAGVAMLPDALSPTARMVVGVGFLGAFTTFSTFSVETLELVRAGRMMAAFGNVGANVMFGFLAAWAGYACSQALWATGGAS